MTTGKPDSEGIMHLPQEGLGQEGQGGDVTTALVFPPIIQEMNAQAQPDQHAQAMASGEVRHVPYVHALQIALGKKSLYFSANNQKAISPEDVHSTNLGGALYLRPEQGSRLVDAQVLGPHIRGDLMKSPEGELDRSELCKLPIVYHLQERKHIRDITDDEAKEAGYANKQQLQVRLALQTDQAETFELILQNKFRDFLKSRVAEENINGAFGVWPKVLEGLRFREITPNGMDSNILQQIAQIANDFQNSLELSKEDIIGTADRFSIREATPEELVECRKMANGEDARKSMGAVLKALHGAISPHSPMLKKPWNDMTGIYGEDTFAGLMKQLQERAHVLAPEPVPEARPTGWEERLAEAEKLVRGFRR